MAHASLEMEILQWDFFKFPERIIHLKSAVISKHRENTAVSRIGRRVITPMLLTLEEQMGEFFHSIFFTTLLSNTVSNYLS